MCTYLQGLAPIPGNRKAIIVKDLASVNNFLLYEGSQAEQFALEVAREIVEKADKDQVRDAIEAVMRRKL